MIELSQHQYNVYINWVRNAVYITTGLGIVLMDGCTKIGGDTESKGFAVCNYDELIIAWLSKNCPFAFIVNYIN